MLCHAKFSQAPTCFELEAKLLRPRAEPNRLPPVRAWAGMIQLLDWKFLILARARHDPIPNQPKRVSDRKFYTMSSTAIRLTSACYSWPPTPFSPPK